MSQNSQLWEFTSDQTDQIEETCGSDFYKIAKICDFCDAFLPLEHISIKCQQCPTIFDQCDQCTEKKENRVICFKDHDTLEKDKQPHFITRSISSLSLDQKMDFLIQKTQNFKIYHSIELEEHNLCFGRDLIVVMSLLLNPIDQPVIPSEDNVETIITPKILSERILRSDKKHNILLGCKIIYNKNTGFALGIPAWKDDFIEEYLKNPQFSSLTSIDFAK